MHVELVKEFRFEAAHRNPCGGAAQQRMHGHGYRAAVIASGEIDEEYGWLVDYGEISAAFRAVFEALDHRCLNDVAGLDDVSLAGLRAWIIERLRPGIPHLSDVRVGICGDGHFDPVVVEPAASEAQPEAGEDGVFRVRFTMECAHYLPQLPSAHKCRRLHGHSFLVEAGTTAPEGVHGAVEPIYAELDHRCLNDIEGLTNPTSENLARWIWTRLAPGHPELKSITIAETCTAKCTYRGPARS